GSGIRLRHAAQDLGLAIRAIRGNALFQRADAAGKPGAAVDEGQELVVERVDLAAKFLYVIRHRPANSAPPARPAGGTARRSLLSRRRCRYGRGCTPFLPWTCSACYGC